MILPIAFCSTGEKNQFRVNDQFTVTVDNISWQEYCEENNITFSEVVKVIEENFKKCYKEIIDLIGINPQVNGLTIKFSVASREKPAFVVSPGEYKIVENEVFKYFPHLRYIYPDVEDSISRRYKTEQLPEEMNLSNPYELNHLAHEMIHLLHGKHYLIGMHWEEGFAYAISEMLFPKDKSNDIVEYILDIFPEFEKLPYCQQWGCDIQEKQIFIQEIFWRKVWERYFNNKPNFIKNFYSNLFSEQDIIINEEKLLEIGEKSEPGFIKWYLEQIAFKKIYEVPRTKTKLSGCVFRKDNDLVLFYFNRIFCLLKAKSPRNIITIVEYYMPLKDKVDIILTRGSHTFTDSITMNDYFSARYGFELEDKIDIIFPDSLFLGSYVWNDTSIIKELIYR